MTSWVPVIRLPHNRTPGQSDRRPVRRMAEGRTARVTALGYRPGLDGIRALAVTIVVASHLDGEGNKGALGWPGVTVFFVLSGFLITRMLLDERGRTGRTDLRHFWRRRAARLLPAAFLVIAVVTLLDPNLPRAVAAGSYATNWMLISGVVVLGPLSHYWSLAVEEQFYLVWPIVLPFLTRPRVLFVCAATITLWRIVQPDTARALFATDTRFDALLIGAAAAMVTLPRIRWWWAALAAGVAVGCMALPESLAPGFGIPAVIAASVVLVAYGLDWRPPRIVAYLGLISYSLYLWHFPIMWMLGPAGLPLALLVAALSYRFFEQPLRRRLAGRQAAPGMTAKPRSIGLEAPTAA